MVWGGINSGARTELHLCTMMVNSDVYIQEILLDHVVPFAASFQDGEFIFQQDNARRQISKKQWNFSQRLAPARRSGQRVVLNLTR